MKRLTAVFLCLIASVVLMLPAFDAPCTAGANASGERIYESNATGAPRAAGRNEASVKALVDAAATATGGYAFGELASASSVPSTVHVAQFGAYGDGVHDDHDALQAAFSSSAETILFEHGATYKVNSSLRIRRSNVTVLGNSATIATDADYNDADERLLSVYGKLPEKSMRDTIADNWQNQPEYFIENVGIYQLNMEARAYERDSGGTDMGTEKQAYNMQLMVQMASNVDIFGCTFTIQQPADGQTVDGCTSLDAYTGWHDLTVENCTVRDFCDKEGGGGMWVRDHFNMGATNVVFKGNDLHKICHDEIVAIFHNDTDTAGVTPRRIKDVLIAENKFRMDEANASPSVMAFRVDYSDGVLIENNEMDVKTTGGLIWAEMNNGLVVRDNRISQARSHVSGSTNFLMFRDAIDLVENNHITLTALDETGSLNDVYVFALDGVVRGNTVTSSLPLGYVASGAQLVEANNIQLNAPTRIVFNANQAVMGNTVELNAHANQYFQYFKTVLAQDVTLSKNTFDNKVEGDSHSVLVLNEATMGGHVVRVYGNELKNNSLDSKARLLFLKLLDEDAQENCVVFAVNTIPDLETYGVYRPDERHTYMVTNEDIFKDEDEGGDSGEGSSSEGDGAATGSKPGQGSAPIVQPSSTTASAPIDIRAATVVLAKSSYTYSGKQIRPAVKHVELAGKTLVAGTDYQVTYGANKNVGLGTIAINGKGGFTGSAVLEFRILPKGTSIAKLTAAKRGFAAKWKKRMTQTTGYQLQWSPKKSFKSKKTLTLGKTKKTSAKVKKLKPKTRYFVRVRTYKKVADTTYYSTWSKVKSVKTKR